MARILIIAGIVLIIIGIIWYFFDDKLSWLGRLPGDIRVEREHFKFYFPFTTMILISLILSLLLHLIKKFL
jgi:H+/Cl- antiporter ClcA